jgi:membrane protein CcdC involved in cytochrome C biogenesis
MSTQPDLNLFIILIIIINQLIDDTVLLILLKLQIYTATYKKINLFDMAMAQSIMYLVQSFVSATPRVRLKLNTIGFRELTEYGVKS